MILNSPYNLSLNSALTCASYRGDISNARQMFGPALRAAGASSAAAKASGGSGNAGVTELQLTPRHCIGSGEL